jgi:magnesium chelatase family protein
LKTSLVDYEKLSDKRLGEPSECVRARVEAARQRQRARFAGTNHTCNADMGPAEVRKFCHLDDTCRSLMKSAMSLHAKHALQLSARGYHRILKLARTIADLAGSKEVGPSHLAEALQYRPRSL